MFTGIIEDMGTVRGLVRKGPDAELTIAPGRMDASGIALGESIAVNGVCLTVKAVSRDSFTIDASAETLSRTSLGTLERGGKVNLERALRAGDRMGGHIVNGHIDGVGRVERIEPLGESKVFWLAVPAGLAKYVVEKGSVAVDGVSLTVNEVRGGRFSVNIIPFTLSETGFGALGVGDVVNIECDIMGKYVERFVEGWQAHKPGLRELMEDE